MTGQIIHEATRTKISVKGDVVDPKELQEVFDKACGGRLASMHISYDKTNDLTTLLLAPCRITEEFIADEDGEQLNYRAVYEIDKCVMQIVFKRFGCDANTFIDKVWMPYKKAQTQNSVVLPRLAESSDCYTFELLSCETRRGTKPATTSFRNRTMKAAKYFFMEFFAPYAERAKPSKPVAALLNELSYVMDDAICNSDKVIASAI